MGRLTTTATPDPLPDRFGDLLGSSCESGRLIDDGPPGIDLRHHPHGLFAHVALRRLLLSDARHWVSLLREDPRAVIAAAWRRAAELAPRPALDEWFEPDEAATSPLDLGDLHGAIISLPHHRCPAAVDFVAAALPARGTDAEERAMYLVSERLISSRGELTSRLGRWRGDGTFENLGLGVPWGQLVFERAVRRTVGSMRSG